MANTPKPLPDTIARWRPENRFLRKVEELKQQAEDAERSTS